MDEAQVQGHRTATRNKMAELGDALLIEMRRKKKNILISKSFNIIATKCLREAVSVNATR